MQIRAKWVKRGLLIIVLVLIGQVLFSKYEFISRRVNKNIPAVYWSHCVNLTHPPTTHLQTLDLLLLDSCYRSLLAKFGMKLLDDTSGDPASLFTTLRKMQGKKLQPSLAQVAVQQNTFKEDIYQWERQELIRVDRDYVDQGKVDPEVVKGYTAAIDKPLFDQFVKQHLPTLSDPSLDQWFTHAMLAIQPDNTNRDTWPKYAHPPRVVPPQYGGDVVYHGGPVLDGITQVYLIFWIDASFQPASPKYISLVEQFINEVGQSPLYANLLQYTDVFGRRPTGARLAASIVDTHPFPSDILAGAAQGNPDTPSSETEWEQEIQEVAASQQWNTQDYHNLFIVLPTMYSSQCGYHSALQTGSVFAAVFDPFNKEKQMCPDVPQSPNNDPAADVAVDTLGHELMESVSDPYGTGWYVGDEASPDPTSEIADKCAYSPPGIDDSVYYGINPKTQGNITWNGHSYILQPEYDNYRHGCVWQGP